MIGMFSKLGSLASFIPSKSDNEGEKGEDDKSNIKNKVLDNNAKMTEFLNENKFDKGELKDSMNDVLKIFKLFFHFYQISLFIKASYFK